MFVSGSIGILRDFLSSQNKSKQFDHQIIIFKKLFFGEILSLKKGNKIQQKRNRERDPLTKERKKHKIIQTS